jgi:voltage-gated potassium channel
LASVVVVIVETEETISRPYEKVFETLNNIFLTIFIVEYIIRIWVMGERAEYSGVSGRVKFAFTLPALIDLLAIVPVFFGSFGSDSLSSEVVAPSAYFNIGEIRPFHDRFSKSKKGTSESKF